MQELFESSGGTKTQGGNPRVISPLVTLPVKLTVRQHAHLKEIKVAHGRSMASQIRTLIQHQMYGIGQTAGNQIPNGIESGPKRTLPITTGNAAYSGCMKELSKIFEMRGRKTK